MVQGSVCLLTSIPSTLIHTLNLFISTAGSLVLLGARNGDERIDLCQMLLLDISDQQKFKEK